MDGWYIDREKTAKNPPSGTGGYSLLTQDEMRHAQEYGRLKVNGLVMQQILDWSLASKRTFIKSNITVWSNVHEDLDELVKFGVLRTEEKESKEGRKYTLYVITRKGHQWLLFAVSCYEERLKKGKQNDTPPTE